MEEPRLGRLNSTNNNSQVADSLMPDPGLPSYNDAIEEDVLADPVARVAADNLHNNMSEIDSDGMIFIGPPAPRGSDTSMDSSTCNDPIDNPCNRQ